MDPEEPATEPEKKWRSVSQRNQYLRCQYQYYLQRVEKQWEKPAAWLPQGLGEHEAVEAFEKSERQMTLEEMQEVFAESYVTHTNRLAEETPNFKHWFRSGPYDGEKDIPRRFIKGMEQLPKYIEYTEKHPEEVPYRFDDGSLYVEHGWEMQLGKVWVRGFTDQVVWDPTLKKYVTRDFKSGNKPGDEFQLATYAVSFEKETGIEIQHGDYFMGRTGKPTLHFDLTEWPESRVTEDFEELDEGVEAGRFEPDPEPDKCRFCSLNAACEFRAADSF